MKFLVDFFIIALTLSFNIIWAKLENFSKMFDFEIIEDKKSDDEIEKRFLDEFLVGNIQ